MLDTCVHTLQCVTCSTNQPAEVTSSAGSKVFLVLWQPTDWVDPWFEVYTCNGHKLPCFSDIEVDEVPLVEHLPGNRAAIAHMATFSHWNLEEGVILGRAGPGNDSDGYDPRNGLLAADGVCSKLVFCPVQSSALYIHDAVTLNLQRTLLPEADCVSQVLAHRMGDLLPCGVWGVYGLLLLQDAYDQEEARCMELLQLSPGRDSYTIVTLGVGSTQEQLTACSCSPCGAYICGIVNDAPEIQVHDLRSGRFILRCMMGPLISGQPESRELRSIMPLCTGVLVAAECWLWCLLPLNCTKIIRSSTSSFCRFSDLLSDDQDGVLL